MTDREHRLEIERSYEARNRTARNKRSNERYYEHRQARLEADRQYRADHVEQRIAARIKWKYGITRAEYDEMYRVQNGLCAICSLPELRPRAGQQLPLSVDHDHKTNTRRGLLCHRCNLALGHFEDDIPRLRAAIRYLRKYQVIYDG